MKLTNISLAVLVALGLVACGGSDDNKNQTTDPKPPKTEVPGGGTPEVPVAPEGESSISPERKAPDLTIPADSKELVAASKRVFIDRTFTDNSLGYSGADGFDYNKKLGTDPANIKLDSTYNFLEESDTVTKPDGGKYTKESIGAIYVGTDPTLATNNAFALNSADKKYYRVQVDNIDTTLIDPSKPELGVVNPYTSDTKFKFVDSSLTDAVEQSDVIFIANADDGAGMDSGTALELGKKDQFDPTKSQVILNSVKVFGISYNASSTGQNLDFQNLNPMREIQSEDITGTYQVINGKGTGTGNDDFSLIKNITLGKIKAYNLPYSIALVTTNVDKDKPAEKDVFNIGAFQTAGFQTVSLPKDGRAFYTGKSFNAKNTGDVKLYADFFEDRAGVTGAIYNRQDNKGNALPDLSLQRIELTDLANGHKVNGNAGVIGQPAFVDTWTVQFHGPEAEEATGTLRSGGAAGVIKEVYNTQRKELSNRSNDASVK